MQYAGQFRVLGGDFYHPALDDAQSADFRNKAARYQKMVSAPPLTASLLRKRTALEVEEIGHRRIQTNSSGESAATDDLDMQITYR